MERKGYRPDRILCSPAARARQTLFLTAAEIMTTPEIVFVDALYNAEAEEYVEQISLYGGDAKTLLVVAHNPATEEAVTILARTADSPHPLPYDYPTGALAVIEFAAGDWTEMRAGTGRLTDFLRPRDLE